MIPDFNFTEPPTPPDEDHFTHRIKIEYGRFKRSDESFLQNVVTLVSNAFIVGRVWNQKPDGMIDYFSGSDDNIPASPFTILIWIHHFVVITLSNFESGIFQPDPVIKGVFQGLEQHLAQQIGNLSRKHLGPDDHPKWLNN